MRGNEGLPAVGTVTTRCGRASRGGATATGEIGDYLFSFAIQ